MNDEPKSRPPSPAKMSKTPSWLMLGFVLGALFVWALPEQEKTPPPPSEKPAVPITTPAPRPPRRLTDIEAVFAQWGRYAVWANDTTEVALWDEQTQTFSEHFEVLRLGDDFFFRSIPKFTRPVIQRGVESQSPLRFTGIANAPSSPAPATPPPSPAPMPSWTPDRPQRVPLQDKPPATPLPPVPTPPAPADLRP